MRYPGPIPINGLFSNKCVFTWGYNSPPEISGTSWSAGFVEGARGVHLEDTQQSPFFCHEKKNNPQVFIMFPY